MVNVVLDFEIEEGKKSFSVLRSCKYVAGNHHHYQPKNFRTYLNSSHVLYIFAI
jgi:hypothetical protein